MVGPSLSAGAATFGRLRSSVCPRSIRRASCCAWLLRACFASTHLASLSHPTVTFLSPMQRIAAFWLCTRTRANTAASAHMSPAADHGIACDSKGLIYVTDHGKQCVHVFTQEGVSVRQWGSEGILDGQFRCPSGIAKCGLWTPTIIAYRCVSAAALLRVHRGYWGTGRTSSQDTLAGQGKDWGDLSCHVLPVSLSCLSCHVLQDMWQDIFSILGRFFFNIGKKVEKCYCLTSQ